MAKSTTYKDSAVDQAIEYAKKFIGVHYRWGGDDPVLNQYQGGFDCSGFITEILQAVGRLRPTAIKELTANGLFNTFKNKSTAIIDVGCLVFWGNPVKSHVEMVCYNENNLVLTIGASGGSEDVTNSEQAAKKNAFVKIRPLLSRPNFTGVVDPFA